MSKLPVVVGLNSIDKPGVPAEHALFAAGAMAPVAHAMATQRLAQKQAARALSNGALTMGLAMRLWDPVVWNEWMQLQAAVVKRLQMQAQDWKQGCAILAEDYAQIRQANTMSKLMEKHCNLMSQSAVLLTNQATNLVALMENIDVDYGYWASQKVGRA
ncbi:hypothetical protein ACHMW6_16435 [Pseudoduganella sp. UC29_106]|uniref:hypothetical protein n=1 Tax=Pseudoduganella sp. UC29_106 TaxID=3374553 RepID=UPI0037565BE4